MGSNPLRWALVGVLVVAVIAVFSNYGNRQTVQAPPVNVQATPAKPVNDEGTPEPDDGDTVAESLSSVQAQYGNLLKTLEAKKQSDSDIQSQMDALRAQIADQETTVQPSADSESVQQLREQVDALSSQLEGRLTDGFDQASQLINGNYQIGLGLNDDSENSETGARPAPLPGYVTLRPLTTSSNAISESESVTTSFRDDPVAQIEQQSSSLLDSLSSEPTKPYATIPARSTLLNAKAMTALIGRVPVGGQVQDPFPVKVIVGANNLAANGHRIDGIDGMIFDGTATGDWTLSCVTVQLTGATFVFEDGTVRHVPSTAQNVQDGVEQGVGAGFGNPNDSVIGYLSDRFGTPCIGGKRLTDAHKQAALSGLMGLAQGHLDAKASAETSTNRDNSGTSSSVTGDADVFAKYSQYANASRAFTDAYRERFQDTFDAIYVSNGADVVANITRDLHIDYVPDSRHLNYSQEHRYAYDLD